MKVTIVSPDEHVRAVAGLAERLEATGHQASVVEAAERFDLDAVAAAASASDLLLGLGDAGPWAVSAAEIVGAVGVLAGMEPMLPTRAFAPLTARLRPPRRLYRVVSALTDARRWATVGPRVNAARQRAGLPRMRNPLHEGPVLGAWSPVLVPAPTDWDAGRVTVTGDWRTPPAGFVPDPGLEAFLAAGDRPIYVGFGARTGPEVEYAVEAVLDAYAKTYRILLASGRAEPGARELPDNVRRVESLPDDWLFSRCGALLHECDAARAHAAARSGIPSIPVPFTPQQRFWADRLHESGAATRPVDPRSGWEAYRTALGQTVPCRDAARALAERIGPEDGVAEAVTTLERVVTATHL